MANDNFHRRKYMVVQMPPQLGRYQGGGTNRNLETNGRRLDDV